MHGYCWGGCVSTVARVTNKRVKSSARDRKRVYNDFVNELGKEAGQTRTCPICGNPGANHFCSYRERRQQGETWEVRQCSRCGYGWTLPQLSAEQLASYYTADYLGDIEKTLDEFSNGTLQGTRSWRRETGKAALVERFQPQGTILDLGCAGASFLLALDPAKWNRFGVELIDEVVELVCSRSPDLEVLQGDIFSASLPKESFDVITLWHVFEHLHKPEAVLRRIRGLLKPGGWIFVSLPNLDSFQARIFRHNWFAFDDIPRHLHHYSPRSLERLFDQAGLTVVDHAFFCQLGNFHQLKHSTIHWSEEHFSSRVPYYLIKPLLLFFPWLEQLTGKFGTMTTVGRSS